MAKKHTYADVMKQLSNKKAQYEKGLEEANRTGNSSGITDYKRRLMKLSAGMDELFSAQEASKAPTQGASFAMGGKTKYNDGGNTGNAPLSGTKFPRDNRMPGLYGSGTSLIPYDGRPGAMVQDGMMAVMSTAAGPVVLTPEMWKTYKTNPSSFNSLVESIKEDPSGAGQRFLFDPESYELGTFAKGKTGVFAANDEATAAIAQGQANVAAEQGGGSADTAVQVDVAAPAAPAAPVSRGGIGELDFMNQMNEQVMAGAAPTQQYEEMVVDGAVIRVPVTDSTVSTPLGDARRAEQAAAATTGIGGGGTRVQGATAATASTPTATTTQAPAFTPIESTNILGPERIMNTAKGDMYYPGGSPRSLEQGPASDPSLMDPTIPTKSHGLGDLANRAANRFAGVGEKLSGAMSGPLGMALGAAAQFLPDRAALKAMNQLQGPVDMPSMRAAQINTDLQVGNQLAQVQQANARANASIDRDISNPAVAAAARRAGQRVAAGQSANILSQEAAQETNFRNQNMQNLIQNQNQNRQINAQNQQRQIDFENERLTAQNRMRQQMSQKLGMAVGDFQNRAMDLKKWNMLSKLDQYGVAGRNDIDPIS